MKSQLHPWFGAALAMLTIGVFFTRVPLVAALAGPDRAHPELLEDRIPPPMLCRCNTWYTADLKSAGNAGTNEQNLQREESKPIATLQSWSALFDFTGTAQPPVEPATIAHARVVDRLRTSYSMLTLSLATVDQPDRLSAGEPLNQSLPNTPIAVLTPGGLSTTLIFSNGILVNALK